MKRSQTRGRRSLWSVVGLLMVLALVAAACAAEDTGARDTAADASSTAAGASSDASAALTAAQGAQAGADAADARAGAAEAEAAAATATADAAAAAAEAAAAAAAEAQAAAELAQATASGSADAIADAEAALADAQAAAEAASEQAAAAQEEAAAAQAEAAAAKAEAAAAQEEAAAAQAEAAAAQEEAASAQAQVDEMEASAAPAPAGDGGLRVALLLPGIKNDNSFSQAAAEGLLEAVAADGNIAEYQILEEIIEPTDSLPALRGFASRGFDLIIGHGIEYVDPIMELYSEFPDVDFAMTGGVLVEGADPQENVVDWLYNVQDMAYPNGVVAANAIIGDTIGIVGGPEFDFVKVMHLSFQQGVASVNPDIQFLEGFAGDFVNVQKAAEVATSLIDQGADLIYCSGDGICIGAAQSASAAGVPILVGFGSQMETAPDVYLGATVIRLSELFQTYFDTVRDGTFGNAFYPGSLQNGGIEVLPINTDATVETAVSTEELQQILDDFIASVESGEFVIPFPF
jgi:basic membrane lipoprotein Med (substrate-binding protein (PBP1-ABC) superfamily)